MGGIAGCDCGLLAKRFSLFPSARARTLHAMMFDAVSVLGGSVSKRDALNLSFRRY
jgi:hypothetical protein